MASDPYKPHFFLGILAGILGVLIWPLYLWGMIGYPLYSHKHLMLQGMFFSFVSGFLMTALPRMSGSRPASIIETRTSVALILTSCSFMLAQVQLLAKIISLFQVLFLLIFIARRFLQKTQSPPSGFIFVPFGLGWLLFGFFIETLEAWAPELVGVSLSRLALVGLEQAFLLNLILGIGSRLVPFLTRVETRDPATVCKSDKAWFLALAMILNINFTFSQLVPQQAYYTIQILVLLFGAWKSLLIFRPTKEVTFQGIGIRASVWCMIAGYVALAFLPDQRTSLLHILFIAGYTLITLMIATRVVLAHGGFSLIPEVRSLALGSLIVLLIVAAVARGSGYLLTAAVLWILAVSVWTVSIGCKTLRT